jgi:hypothetical protein
MKKKKRKRKKRRRKKKKRKTTYSGLRRLMKERCKCFYNWCCRDFVFDCKNRTGKRSVVPAVCRCSGNSV